MDCFCLHLYKTQGVFRTKNYMFVDNTRHCVDWLKKYAYSNCFIYVLAIALNVVDILISLLLEYITRKEHAHSRNIETFSLLSKNFTV